MGPDTLSHAEARSGPGLLGFGLGGRFGRRRVEEGEAVTWRPTNGRGRTAVSRVSMPICQRPVPIATSGVTTSMTSMTTATPTALTTISTQLSGPRRPGGWWSASWLGRRRSRLSVDVVPMAAGIYPGRERATQGVRGPRFGLREPGSVRPRPTRGAGTAPAPRQEGHGQGRSVPADGWAARCGWAAPRAGRRPRRWGSAGGRRRRGWGPRTRPWAGGAGVGAWVPRLTAPGPSILRPGAEDRPRGFGPRAGSAPSDLEHHLPHRLVRSHDAVGLGRLGQRQDGVDDGPQAPVVQAGEAPADEIGDDLRPSRPPCARAACWR